MRTSGLICLITSLLTVVSAGPIHLDQYKRLAQHNVPRYNNVSFVASSSSSSSSLSPSSPQASSPSVTIAPISSSITQNINAAHADGNSIIPVTMSDTDALQPSALATSSVQGKAVPHSSGQILTAASVSYSREFTLNAGSASTSIAVATPAEPQATSIPAVHVTSSSMIQTSSNSSLVAASVLIAGATTQEIKPLPTTSLHLAAPAAVSLPSIASEISQAQATIAATTSGQVASSLAFSSTATNLQPATSSSTEAATPTTVTTSASSTVQPTATTTATTSSELLSAALVLNGKFSLLSNTSTCSSASDQQTVCISGKFAQCDTSTGTYTITSCSTGQTCFAVPDDAVDAIIVGCVDTDLALQALGLEGTSTASAVSSATVVSPTVDATTSTSSTAAQQTTAASTSMSVIATTSLLSSSSSSSSSSVDNTPGTTTVTQPQTPASTHTRHHRTETETDTQAPASTTTTTTNTVPSIPLPTVTENTTPPAAASSTTETQPDGITVVPVTRTHGNGNGNGNAKAAVTISPTTTSTAEQIKVTGIGNANADVIYVTVTDTVTTTTTETTTTTAAAVVTAA